MGKWRFVERSSVFPKINSKVDGPSMLLPSGLNSSPFAQGLSTSLLGRPLGFGWLNHARASAASISNLAFLDAP